MAAQVNKVGCRLLYGKVGRSLLYCNVGCSSLYGQVGHSLVYSKTDSLLYGKYSRLQLTIWKSMLQFSVW